MRWSACVRALLGGSGARCHAPQRGWWPTADGPGLYAGFYIRRLGTAVAACARRSSVSPDVMMYCVAPAPARLSAGGEALMAGDDLAVDLPHGLGVATCLVWTGKGAGAAAGAGRRTTSPRRRRARRAGVQQRLKAMPSGGSRTRAGLRRGGRRRILPPRHWRAVRPAASPGRAAGAGRTCRCRPPPRAGPSAYDDLLAHLERGRRRTHLRGRLEDERQRVALELGPACDSRRSR